STTPGTPVTAASASGSPAIRACSAEASPVGMGRLASSTPVPCTWRSQCGADGSPARATSAARFAATSAGSSPAGPRALPRLKLSNGGSEPPAPWRRVVNAVTPGGAGQLAGRIAARSGPAPMSAPPVARVRGGILAQQPHQLLHVARHRRAGAQRLAGARMGELEGFGVQRLAPQAAQGRDQLVRRSLGELQRPAIERIADDRMAQVLHVHPDLVGAAGLEPAF